MIRMCHLPTRRERSAHAARRPKRDPAEKRHHHGHTYARSPFPIGRMLSPVAQRRIGPRQSQKKKNGAGGFVEDLPNGSPQRAQKASRPGDHRGSALHEMILTQNRGAKRFLITPKQS